MPARRHPAVVPPLKRVRPDYFRVSWFPGATQPFETAAPLMSRPLRPNNHLPPSPRLLAADKRAQALTTLAITLKILGDQAPREIDLALIRAARWLADDNASGFRRRLFAIGDGAQVRL